MFYGNYFNNKYQTLKKKTWSAPTLIAIVIIISMILVFSFEQIGLFRKEYNLNSEVQHIGKSKLNILLKSLFIS